jgi:hypothetical protein
MAVKLGNGNWAVKEDKLLAYNDNSGLFFNKEFDFSRGTSATYVAKDGLIKTAGIQPNIVNNGDFSELGSELVTNGSFDTDSDWLKFNGATISNGVAELDDVSGSVIQQGITTEVGKRYNIKANITGLGNDYYLCVGTGVGTGSSNRNVLHSQSLSATFVATSTLSYIGVRNNANNNTYTIDNVSVKQVDPNDYWTLGGEAIIDNGLVSFVSASNTYSYIRQDVSSLAASLYKISIEVKNYVSGAVQVGFQGSSPNLQNLNVSADGVYTVELSPNANGDDLEISRDFAGGAFDFDVDNVSVQEIQTDTPRIDFTNDTKGHLLLEPQSTNVIENSEVTSTWTYTEFGSGSAGTITTGKTDMFGGTNAVQIDFPADTENVAFRFGQSTSSISSGSVATSAYIKLVESGSKTLQLRASSAVVSLINVNSTDFVRYEMTGTKNSSEAFNIKLRPGEGTSSGGFSIIICHPQEEALSYPTSYIPTTGAASTRNADVCNNSGSAQDFNDSEGVLYAEIQGLVENSPARVISIGEGLNFENGIIMSFDTSNNLIKYKVRSNNITTVDISKGGVDRTLNHKIAVKYKVNDFQIWLDGSKVASTTSGAVPLSLSKIQFSDMNVTGSPFYGKVRNVQVFTEALTDEQLEKLTS